MSDGTVVTSTERGSACASCAVSRRQFIASSTLAAVGALLAACGGGGDGPTGTGGGGTVTPDPVTVKIADYPQLATVGSPVKVPNKNIALVRVAAGSDAASFMALSLRCSHQGYTPIDVRTADFFCPNHNSTFSATGQPTGGPALSEGSGPLTQVAFTFDAAAGTITVT